jgi:hypothetical protein
MDVRCCSGLCRQPRLNGRRHSRMALRGAQKPVPKLLAALGAALLAGGFASIPFWYTQSQASLRAPPAAVLLAGEATALCRTI